MRSYASLAVALCLVLFAAMADAVAMMYKLEANEKACFYAHVSQPPQKVAFYFAVSDTPSPPGQLLLF